MRYHQSDARRFHAIYPFSVNKKLIHVEYFERDHTIISSSKSYEDVMK